MQRGSAQKHQVHCVLEALRDHETYRDVTGWFSAFSVSDEETGATEGGFDDNCATLSGCGERLMRLLQRKELDNLLLIVSEQDHGKQVSLHIARTTAKKTLLEDLMCV